jgi:hypothetical protein
VIVTADDPFRAVFASHPLPMWLYDRETSTILDVNAAALAYYACSREEFLRKNAASLSWPPTDRRHGTDASSNDGPEFELVSHPVDLGGRPAVFVCAHDVTALRRAEHALARAEQDQRRMTVEFEEHVRERTVQLRAAVSELEAFSYSVSHDLRAPLRSIAGFSQALIEDAGDGLSADAYDDISRIVAAAQRMDHLINDLLTLSMVSRSGINREPVDISDLANRILAELGDLSLSRAVATRVQPGMMVQCDPRLVRVVLENLLTNAWKFTSRREQASIEVGQISRDSETAFFVRDNGVGFDPTFADKLFGPFQRLHDASEFPGTGIGLATVRRIVQRHGGRVWAESQLGQGACFYFTLQS